MADEHTGDTTRRNTSPEPDSHPAPFTGRQDAGTAIHACLLAAAQGVGSGLALAAGSGLGKSRLIHEALAGRFGPVGTALYLPCRGSLHRPRDPLEMLVRTLLGVRRGQPGDIQRDRVRYALADLQLGDLTGDFLRLLKLPSADDLPAAQDERDLGGTLLLSGDASLPDALLRLLEAWTRQEAGRSPVVIAFDDLDEASEVMWLTCADLLKQVAGLPVLVMAAYAPDAPRSVHALFEGHTVPLGALSRDETASLVRGLLGAAELTAELETIAWLYAQGHPLRAALLIEYLEESGHLTHDPAARAAGLAGSPDVPGFTGLLAARVRRLDGDQRQSLLAAAVLGDGLRAGALRMLRTHDGAVSEGQVLDDLSALESRDWLERSGEGRRATYRFAQRVIRETIYASIPPDVLKALHRLAGDYYSIPATGRQVRIDLALAHYRRAGEPGRALPALDIALAEASRDGDRERLIALYRQGADIARLDPALADRQAALAEALGDLYVQGGDYAGAVRAYRDLAPEEMPVTLRGKLGLAMLSVSARSAHLILAGVLETSSPADPLDRYWRLMAGHCWGLALCGEVYLAIRTCRDALARMSHTAGLGGARSLLRGTLGMILYYDGQTEDDRREAAAHLESARAGWGARGEEQGVLLMNQVLIGAARDDVTTMWLRMVMKPLLTHPTEESA
jgi:hypothetical protein